MAFSRRLACASSATTTAAPGDIAVHAITVTTTADAAASMRFDWFVITSSP